MSRPPRQSDHQDRRAFAKTICRTLRVLMLPAWGVSRGMTGGSEISRWCSRPNNLL